MTNFEKITQSPEKLAQELYHSYCVSDICRFCNAVHNGVCMEDCVENIAKWLNQESEESE